jgi:hypothetical protein
MARLNLGECCGGEAGMYSYPLTNPLVQGTVIGPVDQVVPAETPAIPSQVMPAPTTMTMPGMVTTAQMTSPNPKPSLTPQDLIRPLPSIVDNQPTQVAQCNSFSEWIDQNPLYAAGLLLGLAWFAFERKG